MCYKLTVIELFTLCGHKVMRQPFIDCNSPNCVRSEYHTVQAHECKLMCKQQLQPEQTANRNVGGRCGQCS
ncbi:hypothetical protein CPB86DRAFT_427129 [Serendipita vermifera]|nr:hypothetical protein CPB86DRAFT_427129 [Serendipita vermifera]